MKKIDIANDIIDNLLDLGFINLETNYDNYEKVKQDAAKLIVERLKDYIIVQGNEVE